MIAAAETVTDNVTVVFCSTVAPLKEERTLAAASLVPDAGVTGHLRLRAETIWSDHCPR